MEKFNRGFTTFMITALKVLLLIALSVSIGTIAVAVKGFNISVIIIAAIVAIVLFICYKTIQGNLSLNKKLYIIMACAFTVRLLWLMNVNSVPSSDFKTMYDCAGNFLQGDRSMFWGSSYIARFPHLTIMVLYMALMRGVFPVNNLIVMKGINLILGVVTVYLIYLIVKEIFNNRKYGLYAAVIASIFPPLVTYTGVFCTENIAIPFYLASIYVFLVVIKNKQSEYMLILCGVLLAFGNLFRMVAAIMLIAYGLYILIYSREKFILRIKQIGLFLIPYFLVMLLVSGILQGMKITEYPLWSGSEPGITNVLKGTNLESGGRWNAEDAAIPELYNYDADKITKASKEIIIERLTTTSPIKLAGFYIKKFAMQWNEGDLAGAFWSQLDVPKEGIKIDVSASGTGVFQLIYVVVMMLVFIGVFNKKAIGENKEINLFYLVLCGYGVMYLVTESQSRYSYIACWVFIILAIQGIDLVLKKFNNVGKIQRASNEKDK